MINALRVTLTQQTYRLLQDMSTLTNLETRLRLLKTSTRESFKSNKKALENIGFYDKEKNHKQARLIKTMTQPIDRIHSGASNELDKAVFNVYNICHELQNRRRVELTLEELFNEYTESACVCLRNLEILDNGTETEIINPVSPFDILIKPSTSFGFSKLQEFLVCLNALDALTTNISLRISRRKTQIKARQILISIGKSLLNLAENG